MKIAAQRVPAFSAGNASKRRSRALGTGVYLTEAMTKPGPCQVRTKTENPCPRRAG